MRVSVQLAYKVPVLGPQDRRLLPSSRPARQELSAQAGVYRDHTGEGVARGARRGLCGQIRGIPVFRRNSGNVLRTLSRPLCAVGVRSAFSGWSRFPPGRTWSWRGESLPLPSSPQPGTHQGLPWCAFQSGYLGLGSGESHPISGVIPEEMGRDVEV